MVVPLSKRVRLSFTRGDQLAQIFVDERSPCAGTAAVALKLENQTSVRETNLLFRSILVFEVFRRKFPMDFLQQSGDFLVRQLGHVLCYCP